MLFANIARQDVYSFAVEHFRDDEKYNVIDVLMKHRGLDVQGAMDYTGELVKERMQSYVSEKAQVPSWGAEINGEVAKYLRMLETWMIANFFWRFFSCLNEGTLEAPRQVAQLRIAFC